MNEILVLLATPLVLGAIFPLVLFECGPEDYVTVPASDPTPPQVAMDVHIPGGPTLNANSGAGPASAHVGPDDVVTAIASGTDADGGVKSIEIWATYTYTSGSSVTGPGLVGAPEAANPSTATPGQNTLKQRILSHNFDIAQIRGSYTGLRIQLWATARNFHGGQANTPQVTLEWP